MSPTASLTSSNTITVSWTAPTVSCPSIDDYIVVYNDGTGNTSVASTGLTATLSNLQSGTTYSLFVAAHSNGVAGLSAATSPAIITTLLASTYRCMYQLSTIGGHINMILCSLSFEECELRITVWACTCSI